MGVNRLNSMQKATNLKKKMCVIIEQFKVYVVVFNEFHFIFLTCDKTLFANITLF